MNLILRRIISVDRFYYSLVYLAVVESDIWVSWGVDGQSRKNTYGRIFFIGDVAI